MLPQRLDDVGDRDTVCASSPDSCSTVSLLSLQGDDEGHGRDAVVTPPPLPTSSSGGDPFTALKPSCVVGASVVHGTQLRHTELDADTLIVTLRLRWRVQLPCRGAAPSSDVLPTPSRNTSASSLASTDGGASHRHHHRCEAGGIAVHPKGHRVVHWPWVYLSYRIPRCREGGDYGHHHHHGGDDDGGHSHHHRRGHAAVLSLLVGRSLFLQSVAALASDQRMSGGGELDRAADTVAASISRHHAELLFFTKWAFADASGSLASVPWDSVGFSEKPQSLTFRSLDVVDRASNTYVNGVPLTRHHRYHFSLDARHSTKATPPFALPGPLVSLGVGEYATLDISLADCDDAVVAEEGEEEEGVEQALLVPSKRRSSLMSLPEGSSLASPGGGGGRRGGGAPSEAAAHRIKRPVAPPRSARATHSSTSAASALVDREASLTAHLLRVSALEQETRQEPLPRRENRGPTSHDGVGAESPKAPTRSAGSRRDHAAASAPECPGASSSSAPFHKEKEDEEEAEENPPSTALSTPSSMRSSTWTETFVETFDDRYDEDNDDGDDAVVGRRSSSKRSSMKQHVSLRRPEGAGEGSAAPLNPANGKAVKRVIYTTGLRLQEDEEKRLSKLGFAVNPDLKKAASAEALVVQRPLVRSVKLLTVLPFVRAVVQRQWLDKVLEEGNAHLHVDGYRYTERRTATSIEGANNFRLDETLRVAPAVRQRLLSPHTFWVHPNAKPQQPPSNDLRSVIKASGGRVTRTAKEASVLVLAAKHLSKSALRALAKEVGTPVDVLLFSSEVLLVDPDSIFRAVLQQRPLEDTCVAVDSPRSTAGSAPPPPPPPPPRLSRASGRRSVAGGGGGGGKRRMSVDAPGGGRAAPPQQAPPPGRHGRAASSVAPPRRKSARNG